MTDLRQAAQQADDWTRCHHCGQTMPPVPLTQTEPVVPVQVADRLARHGINPCPDCRGLGYDASGQLCGCQQNPSF